MTQIYNNAGNPASENMKSASPAESKPKRKVYDLALFRHLYSQLDGEYQKVFSHRLGQLKWMEDKLGQPNIFDNQDGAKIHKQAETLNHELKVMAAFYEFVDDFFQYGIDALGEMSEIYLAEKERADLNHMAYLRALEQDAQTTNTFTNIIFAANGKCN